MIWWVGSRVDTCSERVGRQQTLRASDWVDGRGICTFPVSTALGGWLGLSPSSRPNSQIMAGGILDPKPIEPTHKKEIGDSGAQALTSPSKAASTHTTTPRKNLDPRALRPNLPSACNIRASEVTHEMHALTSPSGRLNSHAMGAEPRPHKPTHKEI